MALVDVTSRRCIVKLVPGGQIRCSDLQSEIIVFLVIFGYFHSFKVLFRYSSDILNHDPNI